MRIPFEKGKIRLTSPYGERELEGTSGFHGGIDIVGLESTRVVSACSGVVAQSTVVTDKSNANWMWGEYIIILGDDGRTYFYFHLASRAVKRFDRVAEGICILRCVRVMRQQESTPPMFSAYRTGRAYIPRMMLFPLKSRETIRLPGQRSIQTGQRRQVCSFPTATVITAGATV